MTHQHEEWQMMESAKGGRYCGACGDHEPPAQVIPDAAVEAAMNARLTFKNQRGMDNATNQMRHILEAAAPHIRAQALEDAADKFGEAASWSGSKPSPEQVQRWLRAGAAAERGAHGND